MWHPIEEIPELTTTFKNEKIEIQYSGLLVLNRGDLYALGYCKRVIVENKSYLEWIVEDFFAESSINYGSFEKWCLVPKEN